MDDPRFEYSEIEEDYRPSYENDTKLGWICRKGISLGKKMVFMGVVISSTPLFVPPILALSALGVVISLPAGFAFVTYASANKLVNLLVPEPPPSPKLEKGPISSDVEYERVDERNVDEGYEEDIDMEAEEREFEEDTREGVEMRIGSMDEDDYGKEPNEVEINATKASEIVEEDGYEEDVGEYEEKEEQTLNSDAVHEVLKGIREAEEEIAILEGQKDEMPVDSLKAVVVDAEVGGENEDKVEQVVENLAFVAPPPHETEKRAHTEDFSGIGEEEMREETTGLIEEVRDEGKDDEKTQDRESKDIEKNQGNGDLPVEDSSQNKESENLSVIPEEAKAETAAPDTGEGQLEILVESKVLVSELVVTAPDQVSTSGSDQASSSPLDEEKVWERIHAIRTIVGCKDTLNPSCVEELKALYLFTGIEPPTSTKGSDDLSDIGEKLRFLMSVIGVE